LENDQVRIETNVHENCNLAASSAGLRRQAQGENNMAIPQGIGGPKTAVPEGIGGPKIARVSNGVQSISFNGQTTSHQTVEIINPNTQKLTWKAKITYTSPEPHGWLQLNPLTHSLNAHTTSNPPAQMDVDKTNLPKGKYTAQVVFSWEEQPSHGDTLEVIVTV
jgi:hypothetical protein